MRWIFFSLLAANLGIFIWWQTAKPQPVAQVQAYQTPEGVGSIVLLNEVPKEQNASPQPTEAPPPEPPADVAAPAPPAQDLAQCVMVGPYESNEILQQALQKLQAKEIKAHPYEMEIPVSAGYQVYLDGFDDRAQAKKKLEELQAKGIDSFIIPKGELLNAIALGSFEREAMAKEQQEKLSVLGIPSKIRESKRPIKELWLALPPEVGDRLPEPLRQTLGIGEKKREERQILCATIASPKNIL